MTAAGAIAGTAFFAYKARCCGPIGGRKLERALSWLASLNFSEWVSLISALVASVSFLLSRAAVRRQQATQLESFRFQRDNALISWANAAIDAIADSQRHCRDIKNGLIHDQAERLAASELRKRLSVLLDSGRLFFPNQPNLGDDEVAPSEIAYEGEAHDAITALYGVYRIISDLGREGGLTPANAVYGIVAHRRRFVSEVFRSVDPLRRSATFAALANGTRLRPAVS